MAKVKKEPRMLFGEYKQSGELVNQHKRMAMGGQVPQGKVPEKKK